MVLGGLAYWAKIQFGINPPVKNPLDNKTTLPLEKLSLPEGFRIDIFASDIENARSMCLSPGNTLFVGTRSSGKVYALRDEDGDFYAEKKYIIYSGGKMPNGVAFKDGDLYVAEVSRILKFEDIESHLDNPGKPLIVYDKFPTEEHHGWKYIAFGPDGKLYVPVGAPCNICESKDSIYASITRMDVDGNHLEIVQRGIRNTVGFTWHPDNGQLWFTDNGRDMMGDDIPNCELNHAPKDHLFFGFPYCHQGDLLDPEFGKGRDCKNYTKPVAKLGPHTAPLGIQYYRNTAFPESFNNKFYIARHGSWNRTEKIGYDVLLVDADKDGKISSVNPFITGWLSADKSDVWGRPVDLELYSDGSLLISDDFANCIYRVSKK
ncbi:MAG: PQQ-dependent sugar dehydrogenase [Saprospiraceae bacterium]|nr:PQQ-dependent sugar dehydrogenase [Saprospiraceae bacterium]